MVDVILRVRCVIGPTSMEMTSTGYQKGVKHRHLIQVLLQITQQERVMVRFAAAVGYISISG